MRFKNIIISATLCLVTASYALDYERYKINVETVKLENKKIREVHAQAEYPYSKDIIWKTLQDFRKFKYFVPRMRKSDVLERVENKALLSTKLDLPWPFPDLWSELEMVSNEEKGEIHWKMKKGNLKRFEGTLWLESIGKRKTRLKVISHINPGHMIPQAVMAWATKKYFPKTLYRLVSRFRTQYYRERRKNRVRSGGKTKSVYDLRSRRRYKPKKEQ